MNRIIIGLLIMGSFLFAECYITNNIKGYTSTADEDYKFSKDGFTNKEFKINLDGKNSSVSNSNLEYFQLSNNSIMGIYRNNDKVVIETWFLDILNKKAIYTKSITGYGVFDGAKTFVGDITKKCN